MSTRLKLFSMAVGVGGGTVLGFYIQDKMIKDYRQKRERIIDEQVELEIEKIMGKGYAKSETHGGAGDNASKEAA